VSFADRAAVIRRATARLCLHLGWAPLHEVTLPSGRRADILALCPDGSFACIEVKSGLRDYQTDAKWPHYVDYADSLYFAVDSDFPQHILPAEVGLIVTHDRLAELLRPAPASRLAPARRNALTRQFAALAALRLATHEDPQGNAELRAALRSE
jgi:hypothetical protein